MKLKPRILSVVIVIFFLTLLIIFSMKSNMESKVQESNTTVENSGVMAWLHAFADRNFLVCDSMLSSKDDGLYSTHIYMLVDDLDYYNYTLNKLVDSISAIEIKSIVKNEETGVVDYTVTVTFDEYKKLGDLVYDKHALDSAKKKYKKDEISDAEFQNELSRVYYEIFCNSCFQTEGVETRQKDLILSEKEVNGVTCVLNTVSFVDSLLADSNVTNNISIYEKDVKGKIENIIKAN